MKNVAALAWTFLFIFYPMGLHADYTSELRDQIRQIQQSNARELHFNYFHDMGIMARKADEAELNPLATEIIKSLLLKKMDEYVKAKINAINDLYETDRYQASRQLQEFQFKRLYEPTQDYLTTTGGQAIQSDLIRFRAEAIEAFKKPCSVENLTTAFQAIMKSGLFVTNTVEEIKSLAALNPKIDCCLGFRSQLSFHNEQAFKSTYEEGTLVIDSQLKLQTSRRDYSDAKWIGDWVQRFKGREGEGEATAQATLQYSKGSETAELLISTSRVSSVGRINFPVTLVGEKRTLEIQGKPLAPAALFAAGKPISLVGCKEEAS